jgi:predicted O-linked N-acetylglucosamine transferase (SPINDLY family)
VTERLQNYGYPWRSLLELGDTTAAEQIRADSIDILIDLAGHTGDNRLPLFALKPAPIQITYLGYPSSTGLRQIDYRLVDHHTDPPGLTEHLHTEKLLRLPNCFLCYQPESTAPEVNPLPAIANGYITFGSFNNLAKISSKTLELWIKLLQALPTSHLLLKNVSFRDELTLAQCIRNFTDQGIDPERLDFRRPISGQRDHLAHYHEIDVGLDSFPYHGTTTTCEALWMGVPVVSLAGGSHVSRVGVSLLSVVGLESLITSTPTEFVDCAIQLSSDLQNLAQLRANLRQQVANSPLCDGLGFVRNLEATYRQVWQTWCSSTIPSTSQ